jgi:hypothetical protein
VLADAVLALQQEVLAIKAQLAQSTRPCSGRLSRPINWKGITEALGALREVLSTPAMQALITGAMPLLAAFLRWLLRWLGS